MVSDSVSLFRSVCWLGEWVAHNMSGCSCRHFAVWPQSCSSVFGTGSEVAISVAVLEGKGTRCCQWAGSSFDDRSGVWQGCCGTEWVSQQT